MESSFPYPSLALFPTTIRVEGKSSVGMGQLKDVRIAVATEGVGACHISKFKFSS